VDIECVVCKNRETRIEHIDTPEPFVCLRCGRLSSIITQESENLSAMDCVEVINGL
jgi:hypothetical protein